MAHESKSRGQLLAGMLAGGGTTAILHPLDLLKVRFQVNSSSSLQQRPPFYTLREFARIIRTSGPQGLYQGFSANWTASMASWGMYFFLYEELKEIFGINKSESPVKLSYFAASGIAGGLTVLMVNPLWVAKTRLCAQLPDLPNKYKGLMDTLLRVGKEEGIPGLYRGLLPGLFGVTHGAVQFTIYDNMKSLHKRLGYESNNASYLMMSTSSKVLAMISTYPYQVIRSRAQLPGVYGQSIKSILLNTWKTEGIVGFYKGIVPSIYRTIPGTALTFLIYENVIHLLNKPNR